jgi:hypothetical protein
MRRRVALLTLVLGVGLVVVGAAMFRKDQPVLIYKPVHGLGTPIRSVDSRRAQPTLGLGLFLGGLSIASASAWTFRRRRAGADRHRGNPSVLG